MKKQCKFRAESNIQDNAITDTQISLPDSKTEDDIMYDKNKRLTIGEMARLTGTSIKSFRYYEQINILKPIYIQPETKYRYYSVEQVQLVEIINFCIELGIPLKELVGLEEKDTGFQNFLDRGKDIAQKKLASINSGLMSV